MPEIKEKETNISSTTPENQVGIVDISRESINREPIPREVRTWMEKVEQASTSQPNTINDDGQLIGVSPKILEPQINLPITKKTFVTGFKKSWLEAGHGLSSFWLRFIKIKKGNVTFKSDDTE